MESGQRLLASASILAWAADCDSPFRVSHSNVNQAAIARTKSELAGFNDHVERRLVRFLHEVVFFGHASLLYGPYRTDNLALDSPSSGVFHLSAPRMAGEFGFGKGNSETICAKFCFARVPTQARIGD